MSVTSVTEGKFCRLRRTQTPPWRGNFVACGVLKHPPHLIGVEKNLLPHPVGPAGISTNAGRVRVVGKVDAANATGVVAGCFWILIGLVFMLTAGTNWHDTILYESSTRTRLQRWTLTTLTSAKSLAC